MNKLNTPSGKNIARIRRLFFPLSLIIRSTGIELKYFVFQLLEIFIYHDVKKETCIAVISLVTCIVLSYQEHRHFSSTVSFQDSQGQSWGRHTNITHFEGKKQETKQATPDKAGSTPQHGSMLFKYLEKQSEIQLPHPFLIILRLKSWMQASTSSSCAVHRQVMQACLLEASTTFIALTVVLLHKQTLNIYKTQSKDIK